MPSSSTTCASSNSSNSLSARALTTCMTPASAAAASSSAEGWPAIRCGLLWFTAAISGHSKRGSSGAAQAAASRPKALILAVIIVLVLIFCSFGGCPVHAQGSGPGFPLLPGRLAQVFYGVAFIDNFHAQQGFEHVFHGDHAGKTAVLVHNHGKMFLFGQQLAEQRLQGNEFGHKQHVAPQLAESGAALVLGLGQHDVAFEHIAANVLVGLTVHGKSRKAA